MGNANVTKWCTDPNISNNYSEGRINKHGDDFDSSNS